eukprot:jgi/Ulvmu1/12327/UM089_0011.1
MVANGVSTRPRSLYSKNLGANANITPDAYTTLPANFDMLAPPAAAVRPSSLLPAKAAGVTYRQRGFTTLPVGAGLYSSLDAGTAEKATLWRNTGPAPLSVGAVALGTPGSSTPPHPISLCHVSHHCDQVPTNGRGRSHSTHPPPPPKSVPTLYRSSSRPPPAAPAPRTLAGTGERRLVGAAARMHGEHNTPEPPRSSEVSAYTRGAFLTMRERIAAMHGVRSQQSLYTSATPRGISQSRAEFSPPAQRPRTGQSEGAHAVSAAGSSAAPTHASAPAQHSPVAVAAPVQLLPSPLSSGHSSSRTWEQGQSEVTAAGERGSTGASSSRMRAVLYGGTPPSAARSAQSGADRRVMRRRTTAMLAATSNADAVSKAAHEAAAAALAEEQRTAAMFGTAGSKRRLHVSGGESTLGEVYGGSGTVAPGSALAAVASGLEGSSTLGSNSSTLSRREAAFAVVMGRASNVFGAGGVMEHRVVGSPAASSDRGGREGGGSQHGEREGRMGGERSAQRAESRPAGIERVESSLADEGSVSSPFADAAAEGGRLPMHLEARGQWMPTE